ncbi:MAG: hypothetical protein IPF54_01580 [Draconibacterium sp.]|nr:hypothetical protein [Draconibacterium sp.]
MKISGDNTISTKIYDGGRIKSVKAKLRLKDDPEKFFEIEFTDDEKKWRQFESRFCFQPKNSGKRIWLV